MNEICITIGNEIISSQKFDTEYKKLFVNLAINQIKNAQNISIEPFELPDLKYLLKCSNIFVQTDNEILKEKALRIAQYTIENGNCLEKDYAYIIIDCLINKPAIDLAKRNYLIDKNIEYFLPLKPSLEKLQRENEHSFVIDNEVIVCNPFQKEFLQKASEPGINMLSISAPTSSGKSFIVSKWIISQLELNNENPVNAAIIVPTRALINQYEIIFKKELENNIANVHIETMPYSKGNILNKKKILYIYTPERMNAFLSTNPNTNFKILFIDEAQKIGDNNRGVLLQTIVEQCHNNQNSPKIIFASPFVEKPENVFLGSIPLKNKNKTVNQNFFKIEQEYRKPLIWNVYTIYNQEQILIAKINLDESKRIVGDSIPTKLATFVTIINNNTESNNLIYANTPSDAESIAELIYNSTSYDVSSNIEIQKLIKLCKETVHKEFSLIKYLEKGIAFHYGSMPQLIRASIEDLFNKKIITNLICTSTLLEGVNLSCKNIFIKNPKRSNLLKMTTPDVFNLVGRAGRLGKEFYGNIFYIDWDDAPLKNEEANIERTVSKILCNNYSTIIESLNNDFNNLEIKNKEERDSIEATIGYLYTQFLKLGNIEKNKEVNNLFTTKEIIKLNEALLEYSKKIELPKCILEKHPVIYHYSMQKLLNYFKSKHPNEPEEYWLDLKNKENIATSLFRFLKRMNSFFNTSIKNNNFSWYIAYLVKHWITFQNLSVIIDFRYERYKETDKHIKNSVRHVFKDIDNYARYLVPKLLRCYIDVLNFYYEQTGNYNLIYCENDIDALLEYGIENKTQISMVTLGLSRATILKIFEIKTEANIFLLDNIDMNEIETLQWLNKNIEYIKNKIPELLVDEIRGVLKIYAACL